MSFPLSESSFCPSLLFFYDYNCYADPRFQPRRQNRLDLYNHGNCTISSAYNFLATPFTDRFNWDSIWNTSPPQNLKDLCEYSLFTAKTRHKNFTLLQIAWKPPPVGWSILNTHGSGRGNPGQAGCRGVYPRIK